MYLRWQTGRVDGETPRIDFHHTGFLVMFEKPNRSSCTLYIYRSTLVASPSANPLHPCAAAPVAPCPAAQSCARKDHVTRDLNRGPR